MFGNFRHLTKTPGKPPFASPFTSQLKMLELASSKRRTTSSYCAGAGAPSEAEAEPSTGSFRMKPQTPTRHERHRPSPLHEYSDRQQLNKMEVVLAAFQAISMWFSMFGCRFSGHTICCCRKKNIRRSGILILSFLFQNYVMLKWIYIRPQTRLRGILWYH